MTSPDAVLEAAIRVYGKIVIKNKKNRENIQIKFLHKSLSKDDLEMEFTECYFHGGWKAESTKQCIAGESVKWKR